jgi:phosphoglucosamine mutase
MGSRKFFGTDGVRGTYGGAVINEDFAWRLGAAAGRHARGQGVNGGVVYLARDTRVSGVSLEQALASGLASEGFTPVSLGVVPTPAVSLALRTAPAVMGVVITASHNPATDNGIKFFAANGVKLSDDQEMEMEDLLPPRRGSEIIPQLGHYDAARLYIETVGGLLAPGSLAGWKVVLDTANGAACSTSRTVLERLGARLVLLGDSPDGQNINAGVGSEHPEAMSAAVRKHGARIGIAHDGDADRCILCDETGSVLDGDETLTVLALHALRHGQLRHRTLVVTVQSNLGVDAALSAAGARVVRTPVGDRYVIEQMLAEDATLGGESSGHVICSDVAPTGDGLVAALRMLQVMLTTGEPLSQLRRALKKFPQETLALKVAEKRPLENLPTLPGVIAEIEREFGDHGRVLVRYSGTEAKLRLLVEGPTVESTGQALARLRKAAEADLLVL